MDRDCVFGARFGTGARVRASELLDLSTPGLRVIEVAKEGRNEGGDGVRCAGGATHQPGVN